MTRGEGLEIRVLGPVKVRFAGQEVALRRLQHRLIVGVLALENNQVVSFDDLVQLLWPDGQPKQPRAVLQTRVSEIRAVLTELGVEQCLTTADGGYLLRLAEGQVDVGLFSSEVTQAREAASDQPAIELLTRALGRWYGPLLGRRRLCAVHQQRWRDLVERRLTATEDLFALRLRQSGAAAVVDQLVALSNRNPLRERLFAQMLAALYRVDRGNEALQEYDRRRRWFAKEFGTDPAREAQAIHRAILQDDLAAVTATLETLDESAGLRRPAGAGRAEEPRQGVPIVDDKPPQLLPADIADFTGREDEIALVSSVLRDGPHRVIVISGEGGVGKTALTTHVAHLLRPEFDQGQLYVSYGEAAGSSRTPAEALGRFLIALGVEAANLPSTLEGRVDLYRDLVSNRRILIVVDNAPGPDHVAPLIPGCTSCAVLINSPVRFGRAIGQYNLDLDRLSPDRAVELLSAIAGPQRVADDPEAALEIARYSGFLPLALRIAGARLAAKPHWPLRKLANRLREEDRRLDELSPGNHLNVRASIAASYRRLAPEAQRLLRLVGRFGLAEVSAWSAAAMMVVSALVAEQCLEQLFDLHLVAVPHPTSWEPQHYVVSDLVRLFARERSEVEDARDELSSAPDGPAPAAAGSDRADSPLPGGPVVDQGEATADSGAWPAATPADPVTAVAEQRSSLRAVAEPPPTW
ncbi:AfsR/SARP family transcriptional regulator [Micromonospora siamensis]|uniref:DNA-binding transcriptional activator of the SARP family n=1 Tax=Micromonospora siamensis TaxID=299152 RepID=A0A1C5J926_9ACTN|nr:transcriptional regulator [Micromonospora siamensis]SCG66751.1 DNA-binding transcriptional activator of the SARP family [Micromonospora siamensis]